MNLYGVGSEVIFDGDKYVVENVTICIDEDGTDITYDIVNPADDADFHWCVDEHELKAVVLTTKVTKKGKVNDLLDQLNSINAVARVLGETEGIVAERQAVIVALQGLTNRG
jgi:hypothetical protein